MRVSARVYVKKEKKKKKRRVEKQKKKRKESDIVVKARVSNLLIMATWC